MHVARLNIGMTEYNTMGKQRWSKYRCVIHNISGDMVGIEI